METPFTSKNIVDDEVVVCRILNKKSQRKESKDIIVKNEKLSFIFEKDKKHNPSSEYNTL
jgi:hypothetical protein